MLDAGMRRSRWTRSSLLVPALLIELAAETGTILRGMNAVMCHDAGARGGVDDVDPRLIVEAAECLDLGRHTRRGHLKSFL